VVIKRKKKDYCNINNIPQEEWGRVYWLYRTGIRNKLPKKKSYSKIRHKLGKE
jgi:hypothetical protein